MTSHNTPKRQRHTVHAELDASRLTLLGRASWSVLVAAIILALGSGAIGFVAADRLGLPNGPSASTPSGTDDGLGPRAAAAIDVAVTQATLLAGLSADNAAMSIAQLRATAAGSWAEQLAADPEGLADELRAANVTATPDVQDAAIVEITNSSVVVLIAGYATVADPNADQDPVRALNLRVTLTRAAHRPDGSNAGNAARRWAVTAVEVIA